MDSTNWHDLPFELKTQIFAAVELPDTDDGTFQTYIDNTADYDDLDTHIVRDLIRRHASHQTRAIEDKLLVCKDFSRALVPALMVHIEDITGSVDRIDDQRTELWDMFCDDFFFYPNSSEPLNDCLALWQDYLERRRKYAPRLLMHFAAQRVPKWHNLPDDIRHYIVRLALPKINDTVFEQAVVDKISSREQRINSHLADMRKAVLRMLAVSRCFASDCQAVSWSLRYDFKRFVSELIVERWFPASPMRSYMVEVEREEIVRDLARQRRTTHQSAGALDHLLDWYNISFDVYGFEHKTSYENSEGDIAELPRYYWKVHPQYMT